MKKAITFSILLILTCFLKVSYGQRKDANLWASISLEKRATSSLLIHYSAAARVGQNITQVNYFFSDIGATYKLHKNIRTSLNYRFINKLTKIQDLSFRHRVYWTLTLKGKIDPIILVYRHRIQYQLEDIHTSEDGQDPNYYTRSKITVKYNLNRFSPYVASELQTKIIDVDQLVSKKFRVFAGCSYMFNKTGEIDLYYLIDRRFNQKDPLTNYVIGIGYTYTFY